VALSEGLRIPSLLAAAIVACAPAVTALADPGTIVLVSPSDLTDAAREMEVRTRGELEAAGFAIVDATSEPGSDIRTTLEAAVTNAGAVAAIALKTDPDASSVEVWVSDRLTNKLSIRRVATTGATDTPELVAIRTVELLRASLIEITDPAPTEPPPPPPQKLPPAVRHLAEPKPERNPTGWRGFGIEVGIAGILHVDPPNPGVAPMARLSYGSKLGVGARLTWIGPSFGPGLAGSLGTSVMGRANLIEELAIAELTVSPALPKPFELMFYAGTGVNHVAGSGTVFNDQKHGVEGLSQTATVFAFTVGLAGAVRVAPHVAIDLDLLGAFTAPRIDIQFGTNNQIGTIGRPTLGATSGVRASF